MRLDDAPADRQTQTGAARASRSSCIDPVEPLAEVWQVLRRDAFAGIYDRDGDAPRLDPRGHFDRPLRRRVPDRVLQQIGKLPGQLRTAARHQERQSNGFRRDPASSTASIRHTAPTSRSRKSSSTGPRWPGISLDRTVKRRIGTLVAQKLFAGNQQITSEQTGFSFQHYKWVTGRHTYALRAPPSGNGVAKTKMSAIVLELHFDRTGASNDYRIRFLFSAPGYDEPRQIASGTVALSLDYLETLRPDPLQYGRRLAAAVFSEQRANALEHARIEAHVLNLPFRIRIHLSPRVPELAEVLWESLCQPEPNGQPFAILPRISLSRFVEPHGWSASRQRPLRHCRALLLLGADNGAGAPIDSVEEQRLVQEALAPIDVTLFDPDDGCAGLQSLLVSGYDFLILSCHSYKQGGGCQPDLHIVGEGGARFETLLQVVREVYLRPRLAVVTAPLSCSVAAVGRIQWASMLAKAGIAAVVTVPDRLIADDRRRFVREFFRQINPKSRITFPEDPRGPTRFSVEVDAALSDTRKVVADTDPLVLPSIYFSVREPRLGWYRPHFTLGETRYPVEKWPHWNTLRSHFARDNYTPILGPDLLEPLVGSWKAIARQLAIDNQIPLVPHIREDLIQVAQFVALRETPEVLYDKLAAVIQQRLSAIVPNPPAIHEDASPLRNCHQHLLQASRVLRQRSPEEAHSLLARLRFSTYVTTSPANILEDALGNVGRMAFSTSSTWRSMADPRSERRESRPLSGEEIARLNQELKERFNRISDLELLTRTQLELNLQSLGGSGLDEVVFKLVEWSESKGRTSDLVKGARAMNPAFRFSSRGQLVETGTGEVSRNRPLVHHIFGLFDQEEELVLTQDDYFEYLVSAGAGIQGGSPSGSPLLPVALAERLADTGLIFLGFHLTDWSFRVLFQSVLRMEGRKAGERYKHVAVQLDPERAPFINAEAAGEYLQAFFPFAGASIFWGSAEDFLLALLEKVGVGVV